MGTLGKMLVVVFGAASIGVFAWSFAVYTQRIAWTSASKDTPGVLDKQKERVADYSRNVDRALNRWSGNLATVQVLEAEKFPRRSFYGNQLNIARTGLMSNAMGQTVKVPEPIQQLVTAANGFLDIRQFVGRPPVVVNDKPLNSIEGYRTLMNQIEQDIVASRNANVTHLADREKLNTEIVGELAPRKVKGLRELITEQRLIETNAGYQDISESDMATNWEADFGLLKKRRDGMRARLDELKR
jgi:hypothetical protein